MPLALRVLFKRIRHRNGPIAEILAVHGLDSCIGGVKAGKVDESVSLRVACIRVTHDLGRLKDDAESAESIVEEFLVNLRVQVADEDVGADIEVLVVRRRFVDSYGFAVKFDHVHNLYGVVCVIFAEELHKPITLMLSCYSIFGHVCVYNRTSL